MLRDLAAAGGVQLADTHYSVTGATSKGRLRQAAPEWAEQLRAEEVDTCLLVATRPVCHESVGLVSRALEQAGIPSVWVRAGR